MDRITTKLLPARKAGAAYHRNFWAMVGDGAFFNVGLTFFEASIVLPVFIASLTPSPLLIGSAAALKTAGWYIPQLPTAVALLGRQRIKGFFLVQALIGRLALVGVVPVVLMAERVPPILVVGLFLPAYAVFAFTEGAATLAWLDLVGKAILHGVRGRFFGTIQLLGGVVSIAAGLATGWLLSGGSLDYPANYAAVFTLGGLAFLVSAGCIALVEEPREVVAARRDGGTALDEVRRTLGDDRLSHVILSQILAGTLYLGLPFYVIFGQQRLGLSSEWIGWFIVAQTVGGTGAAMAWGLIAEQRGPRAVVRLVALLVTIVPLLSALSAGLPEVGGPMLLVAFGGAGAAIGGTKLGYWSYVLELVHPTDRRMYMGWVNTANAPSLSMPLLGGLVVALGGFELLFTTGALLGLVALASTLRLADTRSARPLGTESDEGE